MRKNNIASAATYRAEQQQAAAEAVKCEEEKVKTTNDLITSINNLNASLVSGQSAQLNALISVVNKINSSLSSGQRINAEVLQNSTNDLNMSVSSVQQELSILSQNIESLRDYRNEFTTIINKQALTATNGYDVLNQDGCGLLRELTVSLNIKPNLYMKVNNKEVYNIHASFDDLSTISKYSENISAIKSPNGTEYIFNIKNIKFTDNISVQIFFDGNATINNVYCLYDLRK